MSDFRAGSLITIKPKELAEIMKLKNLDGAFVQRMRVPGIRLIVSTEGKAGHGTWTVIGPDGIAYVVLPEHQWLYEKVL